MNTILEKIKAWATEKGGWAHIIAVVYAGAILAYGTVPSFHALVMDVWAHFPKWGSELTLAILGLIAWYKTTNKS